MSKNAEKGGIKMKSTGIVRKVDELGRVVIPIELRNQFNIEEKDPIEIFVDGRCTLKIQRIAEQQSLIQWVDA